MIAQRLGAPSRKTLAAMLDDFVAAEQDDLAALAAACSVATLEDLGRPPEEEAEEVEVDPRF